MGTISKALDLLNLFASDRAEIGLADFVRLSGRDKATVHRHLTELAENGFLEQNPESRAYRLGPAVLRLSALRETLFPMRKLLQPIVAELSQEVGELAHASLFQSDIMSPLVHADPLLHGVQVHFDIAEMLPLHATSSGLVALAFSTEAVQEKFLSQNLVQHTPNTICDPEELRQQIQAIRKYGLCTLAAAFDADVTSVGAPVFSAGLHVAGALAVAVPSVRVTPSTLTKIGKAVLRHAETASVAIGGAYPKTLSPIPDDWAASAPIPA